MNAYGRWQQYCLVGGNQAAGTTGPKTGSAWVLGMVGVVVLAVVVLLGLMFWRMNVNKGEIGLANRYEAQFNVVENTLFKMRTTVKNMHQCTDEWANKFIAVVAEQAKGRSGMSGRVQATGAEAAVAGTAAATGSSGFTFARESESLGLTPELYAKLSNAIEGQVGEFTRQQDTLTDIWREHKTYCEDPYHNWLGLSLKDKVKPKPEMITSAEVKDAVTTKKMNEKLF